MRKYSNCNIIENDNRIISTNSFIFFFILYTITENYEMKKIKKTEGNNPSVHPYFLINNLRYPLLDQLPLVEYQSILHRYNL